MASEHEKPNQVIYRSAYLNVTLRHTDGVVELGIDGEIDLASADGLSYVMRCLDDVIHSDGAGPSSVLVDMADVSFCDGSGVAFLVGMQTKVQDAGSQFAVRDASPIVRRLLGLLDLDSLLECGHT
jgi:anti-anti-sigma factor